MKEQLNCGRKKQKIDSTQSMSAPSTEDIAKCDSREQSIDLTTTESFTPEKTS